MWRDDATNHARGNQVYGTSTSTRPADPSAVCWVKAADYVVVMGKPTKADVEACWNLGATSPLS